MRRFSFLAGVVLAILIGGQPVLAAECLFGLSIPDPPSDKYDFALFVLDAEPGKHDLEMSLAVSVLLPDRYPFVQPAGPATRFVLEVPQGEGHTKIPFYLADRSRPDIEARISGNGCEQTATASFRDLPPTSNSSGQASSVTGSEIPAMPLGLLLTTAAILLFLRRRASVGRR